MYVTDDVGIKLIIDKNEEAISPIFKLANSLA